MHLENSVRKYLLQHPVYDQINSPEHLRIFMEHHVFAVWDFMSLLKSLQQLLTCVQLPWHPNKDSKHARFINEIVLAEETDEDGKGGYCSHFELYIQAMQEIGADINPISHFLYSLQSGKSPDEILGQLNISDAIKEFVKSTLQLALHGKPHEITASFFFGREDLIPDMFTVLLRKMNNAGLSTSRLNYYLQRHIELDGDTHGPMAEELLNFVCENDLTKKMEAEKTASHSIELRIKLWDSVLSELTVQIPS